MYVVGTSKVFFIIHIKMKWERPYIFSNKACTHYANCVVVILVVISIMPHLHTVRKSLCTKKKRIFAAAK